MIKRVLKSLLKAVVSPTPSESSRSLEEPPETMIDNAPVEFWKAVKLVHCEELKHWDRFPKYQEHEALSYFDYQMEAKRIEKLKRRFYKFVRASERLPELDRDELEFYDAFEIEVAPSIFREIKQVTLEKPEHANTVVTANVGTVENGVLSVKAGWLKKKVDIEYHCPMRDLNAEEIKSLQETLSNMDGTERAALQEIKESKATQPVLFVSHRWETLEHPDPQAMQLEKLRELERCFIIYDYTSFPQSPLSEEEAEKLRLILSYMGKLIRNVIVLAAPGYDTRGWCLYEYIVSSLISQIVCDEIQEPDFVSLRNWASTRPTLELSPWRNSFGSMQQNYISEAILTTVNKIIPKYRDALFSVEDDRAIVDKLLFKHLSEILPAKKRHVESFGEWQTEKWTDEELADAFKKELTWEHDSTQRITEHRMNVPQTLGEAVRRGYAIDRDEPSLLRL